MLRYDSVVKGRRRKIITRVIVFLLLGAIVNVAVAWGCALASHRALGTSCDELQPFALECLEAQNAIPPIDDLNDVAVLSCAHGLAVQAMQVAAPGYGHDGATFGYRPFAIVTAAGFPAFAFCGIQREDQNSGKTIETRGLIPVGITTDPTIGSLPHQIPITPVLPGFAINTIFYAAILWLLFFAPGSVRRTLRRRRGLCPACAYPVGTSPVCTECGRQVTSQKAETQKAEIA